MRKKGWLEKRQPIHNRSLFIEWLLDVSYCAKCCRSRPSLSSPQVPQGRKGRLGGCDKFKVAIPSLLLLRLRNGVGFSSPWIEAVLIVCWTRRGQQKWCLELLRLGHEKLCLECPLSKILRSCVKGPTAMKSSRHKKPKPWLEVLEPGCHGRQVQAEWLSSTRHVREEATVDGNPPSAAFSWIQDQLSSRVLNSWATKWWSKYNSRYKPLSFEIEFDAIPWTERLTHLVNVIE